MASSDVPLSETKSSFAPVVDLNTLLLVLGSLPGEVSLARSQYYANDRNQFWRLMTEVIAEPMPDRYEIRLQTLLRAGVGLWDVIASAKRVGSLDAAIRQPRANPLEALCSSLPALRAVAFNGGKASAIGRGLLAGKSGVELLDLPSSSPAHTLAFDEKARAWRALRPYLGGSSAH